MKIILENWELLLAVLGPLAGFFTGWKSRRVDIKKKEIDALQNMQVAYDKFTEQTNTQIDRLTNEINFLKEQNLSQAKTLRLLQEDNGRMHIEVSKLTIENSELRKMIEELKSENLKLKGKR